MKRLANSNLLKIIYFCLCIRGLKFKVGNVPRPPASLIATTMSTFDTKNIGAPMIGYWMFIIFVKAVSIFIGISLRRNEF